MRLDTPELLLFVLLPVALGEAEPDPEPEPETVWDAPAEGVAWVG